MSGRLNVKLLEFIPQHLGSEANARRDSDQTLRFVPESIHGGHISEQSLSSADVGCRFVPLDVLLPHL